MGLMCVEREASTRHSHWTALSSPTRLSCEEPPYITEPPPYWEGGIYSRIETILLKYWELFVCHFDYVCKNAKALKLVGVGTVK